MIFLLMFFIKRQTICVHFINFIILGFISANHASERSRMLFSADHDPAAQWIYKTITMVGHGHQI